jgi:hypothetical protein
LIRRTAAISLTIDVIFEVFGQLVILDCDREEQTSLFVAIGLLSPAEELASIFPVQRGLFRIVQAFLVRGLRPRGRLIVSMTAGDRASLLRWVLTAA